MLFGFFVTLYAISQVDAKKMTTLAHSMQAAFDTRTFDAGSRRLSLSEGITLGVEQLKLIEPANPMLAGDDLSLQQVRGVVHQRLVKENSLDRVRLTQDRRGLVISLSEAGFFDSGAATMKDSSLRLLNAIAESEFALAQSDKDRGAYWQHAHSYRPVPLELGTVYSARDSSDRLRYQLGSVPGQRPLGDWLWRASACGKRMPPLKDGR